MIRVTVDNRLRMHSDDLSEELREHLQEEFTHNNPQHAKLVAMGRPYNSEPKQYVMWQVGAQQLDGDFDPEEFSLPRGGMQVLRDACNEFDLDYEVVDNRSTGAPSITGSYVDAWQLGHDLFPPHKLVAWDHQREMCDAMEKFGQILERAPTGSGKTSAIIKRIAEAQVPALVIMWDSGLLKQWQERIEEELGIEVKQQGLIRGPVCRLKPITLAMQQTLARWDDAKWAKLQHEGKSVFGSVYCDEVQRYAAKTFIGQIDRFDCHGRVGVSADERRKDRKTFLIYDMFGPVRHEVSKQELVKKRIIHEVECYVVPTSFRADWYVELKEDGMLDLEHHKRLLDEMATDETRNAQAVHLIEECVQAGLPTLSFTQWVDHARRLDTILTSHGVASGLALGGKEWEETFDETIARLRDGSLQVGCGTFGKLGVGHDIPTVAAGLAVTPVHNNRGFLGQVKGRICRTTQGKENARILIMWDRLVYGDGPLVNLRAWNEVCRVWCEWDRRWKDIGEYMKENQNGIRSESSATPIEEAAGIFLNANG